MSRTARNSLLLLLITALVASFSLSVLAASEGEEGAEDDGAGSTTTTIQSGLSPAVSIVEEEAAEPVADWTYRYMIPTGLALGVIVILVTAIKYFTDVVRKRYRIVEE
ncbi:MAG TPA: hypothetical protein VF115_16305 [Acidimicrobiia bacterium]